MRIAIIVKAGSKKGPLIEPGLPGEMVVYVRPPAVAGQANAAVIKLLADYYKVSKSRITIVRGHTAHLKIIEVARM